MGDAPAAPWTAKLLGLAMRVGGSIAATCGAPGCTMRSPGIGCGECGVPMCMVHVCAAAAPLRAICGRCAAKLWGVRLKAVQPQAETEEAQPRRRRSA